ncbi:MAG TPA: hypothetical protein VF239_18835 [Vicinamibacterales bacterium]
MRSAFVALLGILCVCSNAGAQSVELTPFGGYRFGAGVGVVDGAPVVDDDGGVSFGMVLDIPFGDPRGGRKFEAVFSRAQARVTAQPTFFSPPIRELTTVDHMMVGLMQELDPLPGAAASAFISGLVGVSRYAAAGDTELLFSIGLGAGGRFFATRHLGLRVEGRGYMTIVDLGGAAACSGGCTILLRANPVFQADLTAGVIVAF